MAEFVFRGKGLEEIKKMNLTEFSQLVTAKERRVIKRGFRESWKTLLRNIRKNPKGFHRTADRDIIIIPEILDVTLGVHNGKEYIPLQIKPEMLGHRIGEFVLTRKTVKHSAPGFGATKSSKYIPLK